jgi:hypothetical protein
VHNLTGLRLWHWLEGGGATATSAAADATSAAPEPAPLEPGDMAPLELSAHDEPAGADGGAVDDDGGVDAALHGRPRRRARLSLQLSGSFTPVRGIAVHRVGEWRFVTKSLLDGAPVDIYVSVSLAGRLKTVTLHSGLQLLNATATSLAFWLHSPRAPAHDPALPTRARLPPVAARGGALFLPLTAALPGALLYLEAEGYALSQRDVIDVAAALAEPASQQGVIRCPPRLAAAPAATPDVPQGGSGSDAAAAGAAAPAPAQHAFFCCLHVQPAPQQHASGAERPTSSSSAAAATASSSSSSSSSLSGAAPCGGPAPRLQLIFRPALALENALPYEVHVVVQDRTAGANFSVRIAAGDTAQVDGADLDHELSITACVPARNLVARGLGAVVSAPARYEARTALGRGVVGLTNRVRTADASVFRENEFVTLDVRRFDDRLGDRLVLERPTSGGGGAPAAHDDGQHEGSAGCVARGAAGLHARAADALARTTRLPLPPPMRDLVERTAYGPGAITIIHLEHQIGTESRARHVALFAPFFVINRTGRLLHFADGMRTRTVHGCARARALCACVLWRVSLWMRL